MVGESGGSFSGRLRDERFAPAVYGGRINGKQQVYPHPPSARRQHANGENRFVF